VLLIPIIIIPSDDDPFFGTLDLPGFTRSVFKRDHALITPESHVFSPLPDWYDFLSFTNFYSFLKLC
jgi:hypothetical protein